MYGARGRIGHICPSAPLDMIINEFQEVLPEGVLAVYTSLLIERLQQSDFDRAIATLDTAAGHMVEGEVGCILVGGGPVVTAGLWKLESEDDSFFDQFDLMLMAGARFRL